MFDTSGSRCARVSKLTKRRLGAEPLEDRSLLSAVMTPAAVDAASLAMAVEASAPTAGMNMPTPGAAANQALVNRSDSAFVTSVYRHLLGRAPNNSELQYWQGFLNANTAPLQSTGSGGVGSALTGAPVNGYALSEFPGMGGNDPVPTAPTSGAGVAIREFDFGRDRGSSEAAYHNGTGPFTTGLNGGVIGGAPGSTLPVATVSSEAAAESVNMATAQSTNRADARFVQDVLSSPEYRRRVVTQIYHDFLHRAPGNQALAFWSARLAESGERGVLVSVLASPEYFHDAGGTQAGYVDSLYRDLLSRSPDGQDRQFWVSQLDADGGGGDARGMVAADILDSPEASHLLINDPAPSALAELTGGGFNQDLFQGGLAAAQQMSYAAAFGGNRAFESVIESMVAGNQAYMYHTGPGPMDNPGYPSADLGSTSS